MREKFGIKKNIPDHLTVDLVKKYAENHSPGGYVMEGGKERLILRWYPHFVWLEGDDGEPYTCQWTELARQAWVMMTGGSVG